MSSKPFLRQVADHYIDAGDLHDRVFVFPNRRSLAFFKKYLKDALVDRGIMTPLMAPRMLAVNDFFTRLSGRRIADRITLLLKLYDCYTALNRKAESLDDFIFWGDVLLSDFADVDRYMVDARGLYANISDFRDMRDDFSYLSQEQFDAIRKLASHFSAERWAPGKAPEGKDVKENFLLIWQLLYPLYSSFRESLSKEGLAYEGMIYRDLADKLAQTRASELLEAEFPHCEKCVFIGLNALSRSEKSILKALDREGLAEFCWDFPGPMISDPKNPSSFFMKDNLKDFPNAFTPDPEGLGKPLVHVVSVPSATGQAKLLPNMLSEIPDKECGLDFSVVLPDESMLMPVLSSLPEKVKNVNVTMGYPLSTSDWNALMRSIMTMQIHLRSGGSFYYKQVYDIFSNAIFKSVMGEEDEALVAAVRAAAKAYIPASDLQGTPLFSRVFRPVVTDMKSPSASQCREICSYLADLSYEMASQLDKDKDALHMECARHYHCCVTRLSGLDLPVLPQTLFHLLEQLIAGISVPFAGEPLGGMQIMGPLETRALDFKRMVIMNANDSVFPSRNVSSSFIPPEMRRAFGLPTYEYQDAIWAYYFYRMIARCQELWLVFDSRTEGLNTGEESRYIKQLRYLYKDMCVLDECVAVSDIDSRSEETEIVKTQEDIDKIREMRFSASTIQRYISCPASFYYNCVKELRQENEVNESLDPGTLGDVCHDTLQALFCGEDEMRSDTDFDKRRKSRVKHMETVSREYLMDWYDREEDIRWKVMSLIRNKTRSNTVEGRDLVSAEIAVRFVRAVIKTDIDRLGHRSGFRLVDVERPGYAVIAGHQFGGYIDRLDSIDGTTLRIVDYKTGGDRQNVLETSLKPDDKADTVFGLKNQEDTHSLKAALQFYIYKCMVEQDNELNEKYSDYRNAMYSMSDIFLKGGIVDWPVDGKFNSCLESRLVKLFEEMEDINVGFKRTQSESACKYCDYRLLCGRVGKKD